MALVGAEPIGGGRAAAGQTTPAGRDLAANAAILGFAAAAWFAWAQQGPPAGWPGFLTAGSVLGLLAAVVGAAAVRLSRGPGGGPPSAMMDPANRRRYNVTVGAEVIACLLGALALGRAGAAAYVPAWILLVVGVHFLPLARVFRIHSLVPLAVVCVLVAVAAVLLGRAGGVLPSTVAGAGAGLAMLVESVASLLAWRRARVPSGAV